MASLHGTGPSRIAAACVDDGELLGQVEPKQIKNTYVYEKKGDSWQLTDFRPSI